MGQARGRSRRAQMLQGFNRGFFEKRGKVVPGFGIKRSWLRGVKSIKGGNRKTDYMTAYLDTPIYCSSKQKRNDNRSAIQTVD